LTSEKGRDRISLGLAMRRRWKMAEVKGYCVKCKKKQTMDKAKEVTLKNGRKATKGECPKCGTKMFRIGG
jgi:predicted RNA-binding Zn-ribbon protein involved in translation (DUF1610 family)